MISIDEEKAEVAAKPRIDEGGLIACHECDLLHAIKPVPAGGKALCVRCDALLYKSTPNSLNRSLALNLTALILFFIANLLPFLTLKTGGREEVNIMMSGAIALQREGMPELGLLVFLTSFLFPLLTIAGMLYILIPLKFGYRVLGLSKAYRMVKVLTPWSLIGVFMLGVLISFVKLLDLATVVPGVSLFAFALLIVAATAAHASLDTSVVWPYFIYGQGRGVAGETAARRGLVSCHTCALLVTMSSLKAHGHGKCPRCGSAMHSRKTDSVIRTWALIFTTAILFIPANVYPVMTVIQFGRGDPNTILSGVVHLIEGGMWGLALIIFFASIVVPLLKLIVLSSLLISVERKSQWRLHDRTLLFRVTEAVGAWSMVDIYVVAILVALVKFGALSTITPGIGATFFAAVVVSTMFAAHSFDPRLIWDNIERPK